jgi:hypothetical protein
MENFNEILNNNSSLYKSINDLLCFLNDILFKLNIDYQHSNNKIDLYDIFYYIISYNSSTDTTHRLTLTKYNIEFDKQITKNTFINRLIKMDISTIKNINNQLINYFYDYFKIDKTKLECASDGSSIKLLANLKDFYKLNKNKLYTDATINCIIDVNNNIPLSFDIFNSFSETNNLTKQLNEQHIKDNNYKITCITDRGYDDTNIINYYIKNNLLFICRIVKNNKYIKNLINNEKDKIFQTTINKEKHSIKILKYTNIEKPDFFEKKKEFEDELIELNININNINTKILKINKEIKECSTENKKKIELLKKNKSDSKNKKEEKIINKSIVVGRAKKKH